MPLSIATGLLWSIGGAYKKVFRRVGCALLPCLVVFAIFQKWQVFISFPLAWAVLSIGYGTVTYDPNKPGVITDAGSFLGRFFENIYFWMEHTGAPISGREKFVNFWTRSLIYLLLFFSFTPVWIIQKPT